MKGFNIGKDKELKFKQFYLTKIKILITNSIFVNQFDVMDTLTEGITASEKAQLKALELMKQAGIEDDSYFLRVSVVGGGCSGLSYKLDFDNELNSSDQVFETENLKIVTDIKSLLYLLNTELDYSDGLNGKGFLFKNPNASRTCGCGESFAV